jgi:hypothetical protein
VKKVLTALAIVGGVTLLLSPFAVSTPEYAKKEGAQCVVCHTAVGKADLNDAGKYYKDHKSLDGYTGKR